jgi:NitT/TauT family transport system substrate-binding protein/sulfonate transport system substrate-binding protein
MYEDDKHPISLLLVKDTTSIKSISDLKGKKIGILPTRAYEVWIEEILKANGVAVEDVIIRQVKPNLQADALNNGSIDALFTNDPAEAPRAGARAPRGRRRARPRTPR